ncbi:MAG: hypothetical protein JRJ68_04680 [Deltaproteobacteria bacterium]|nr:hypothetical protein [Deltaproteobacteria bacterium]
MSRKNFIQILSSLAVLCCIVLPANAAPKINIVPLVQLLLLNPLEVTVVDSGMQGIDSSGGVITGSPFSTDDQKVCLTSTLKFGPGTIHLTVEWFKDAASYKTTTDLDITAQDPVQVDIVDCIIDNTAIPPLTAPASDNWEVRLSTDGTIKDKQPFVIQAP